MAELGQKYIVKISSDGTTYNDIGTLTSFSLSRERGLANINNFDSASTEVNISAMRSWSIDNDALYTYSDTGQQAVEAAYASDSLYYFKLTSAAGTSGVYEFAGQGWVTELSIEGETNEAVQYSISIKGDGALTRSAIV